MDFLNDGRTRLARIGAVITAAATVHATAV